MPNGIHIVKAENRSVALTVSTNGQKIYGSLLAGSNDEQNFTFDNIPGSNQFRIRSHSTSKYLSNTRLGSPVGLESDPNWSSVLWTTVEVPGGSLIVPVEEQNWALGMHGQENGYLVYMFARVPDEQRIIWYLW